MLDAFHAAYPDIKVEIVDTPSADYTAKLSVQLNGGSDIDAFWIKDDDTSKGLADKGQLADLTDYIARDGVNLADFNGLADYVTFDGKVMALPARSDYYVLFYNKDIFDAAGVPYPSNDMTWTEWEALCAQLTSGEGADKKYGGHFHTWNACVENWAVQDGKNTIMSTDYSFFKPYYEMALRMQAAGTVMDYATLTTGQIHYSGAFASGNVATLPMGTFYFTNIIGAISRGESSVNWGVATLPHPEGVEAGWTVGSITPIAINNASQNKDAAWEFLKFVTGPEGAKIYAEGFNFPGRSSSDVLQSIASAEGMPEGALEALQVKNIVLDRPYADKVGEVNAMLGEQHGLIMLGEAPIDTALAEMSKLSAEIQG
jgi:multiple sugar transport system substrate-binding protein